jgi:hypothetical protein
LKEEHRLGDFENRVLRKLFGPKRDEVTGIGESYTTRSLMICSPHQIYVIGAIKSRKLNVGAM